MLTSCHACQALRHWLIINANNALTFRLIGALDETHEQAANQARRAYGQAGPHTCGTSRNNGHFEATR